MLHGFDLIVNCSSLAVRNTQQTQSHSEQSGLAKWQILRLEMNMLILWELPHPGLKYLFSTYVSPPTDLRSVFVSTQQSS